MVEETQEFKLSEVEKRLLIDNLIDVARSRLNDMQDEGATEIKLKLVEASVIRIRRILASPLG